MPFLNKQTWWSCPHNAVTRVMRIASHNKFIYCDLVLFNNTQKQSPKSSQSRELVDTTSFLPQSRPHTVLESMLGWLGPQCVVGSPAGFFSTLIFHTLCVFTCKKIHNIYTFFQVYSQGTLVFCIYIVFILSNKH